MNGEPWTSDELAFLQQEWLGVPAAERDEFEIAVCLERTVEACRNQAHYLLHGKKSGTNRTRKAKVTKTTTKTTTTTTEYIGALDDPEEQWWA